MQGPVEEGSTDAVDEAIRTLPPLAIEAKPVVRREEVVKVERAEAEAPVVIATVVEPIPLKAVTPAKTPEKASEKAKVETVEEKEEERPFYGLPDDPGVKEGAVKRDGTSGFRLF